MDNELLYLAMWVVGSRLRAIDAELASGRAGDAEGLRAERVKAEKAIEVITERLCREACHGN